MWWYVCPCKDEWRRDRNDSSSFSFGKPSSYENSKTKGKNGWNLLIQGSEDDIYEPFKTRGISNGGNKRIIFMWGSGLRIRKDQITD
jgi:hypothetical protein